MKLTDKCLENFPNLLAMVLEENHKQLHKWGVQTHSSFEWLAYTTEELGELSKAISEYEYRDGIMEDIIDEAVQVATLSLKIAEMFITQKAGE